MTNYPSVDIEARLALHVDVEQARKRVIDQIGMPWWYWWGLAVCWIGLGVAADVANPWVTLAATFTFGAVHSYVSWRLLAGRQRTSDVKVRADVAGRRAPTLIFAFLVGLGAVTVPLRSSRTQTVPATRRRWPAFSSQSPYCLAGRA